MIACIDRILHSDARVPLSTYRIQLHAGFAFADAEGVLEYLKKLGIGDVYTSPIFEARPGTMHGYDVTRHDRLNPELGGDRGFERFSQELERCGLGLLLDIVPNHMGVGNDSLWWQDVLENGRASRYSGYFDIDWAPLKPAMRDKLLLPILGNQYGVELAQGRIQVEMEGGKGRIRYYDHVMPLAPRTLPLLFPPEDDRENGVTPEIRDLLTELASIPPHETVDETLLERRRLRLAELLPRLREALQSAEMQPAVARAVARINGAPGDGGSFDRLHALLDAQPYRLASWRTSAEEINYRRFFDVNDLVGLRMENPAVFRATHGLIRSLLARRKVTGLRIDHCDGMFNPRQYLIRLQRLYLASQCCGETPQGETAESGIERAVLELTRGFDWSRNQGPLYAVVEKILEPREYLPANWPVRGTSGYDFLYLANAVFIQKANEREFTQIYDRFTGGHADPDDIVYRCKLQVMQTSLASEVYALTNLLSRIAASNRYARDFTDNILELVIRQTVASFPVYRTYIDESGEYSDRDVAFLRFAIARAKRLNPEVDASAFDFLRETLLLRGPSPEPSGARSPDPAMLYFALKFQQLTGPVMAKGVEDTAFYVYCRFVSSNEVGGFIKSFGISVETLHQASKERLRLSPDSMLATSTHDTKRSEDVRNRLNVLSEMPRTWSRAVRQWGRMNAKHKRALEDGRIAPDRNEEYLLYQSIVGAWPWRMDTAEEREEFLRRMQEYAAKALREAKVNLSWINPDQAYLDAVNAFLQAILAPGARGAEGPFVLSLQRMMPPLRLFGALNSLSQLVLKIASPGVPDFYQGSELWDLSLVDPDNRRPVDYRLRGGYLDAMRETAAAKGAAALCRELLENFADGRAKLWTTHRALGLRSREQELFRHGEYLPVEAAGVNPEHVIAFLRRAPAGGRSVLAVLPRFACTLMAGKAQFPLEKAWGNARLQLPVPGERFTNVFTDETLTVDAGGRLPLTAIFSSFPVALLAGDGAARPN